MRQLRNFKSNGGSGSESVQKPEIPEKYAGMDENELRSELIRQVASAKSDGTFSPEQIDEFVEIVSPNLDDEARAKLMELVSMIKSM